MHSSAEFQQRIDRIYDHLYANSPVRTPSGIALEVGKVLYAVMFIEQGKDDGTPAFQFESAYLRKIFELNNLLSLETSQTLRDSFSRMNQEWKLYPPNEKILLEDSDIAYTCGQLNNILLSTDKYDAFGDALEIFRGQWSKRTGGQFFTDRRVTSLALELMNFNPFEDDLVDLCAGTGGFLLAGLSVIKNRIESCCPTSVNDSYEAKFAELAARKLKGREIDSAVSEIANATLSARLGGLNLKCISTGDSLKILDFPSHEDSNIQESRHRCAATNPPFGTKITIKDKDVLKNFSLAYKNKRVSMRAPDILFIEQNVRILVPGEGRLAIVVPYQIISGPQTRFVREWILLQTQILAVIDLPPETFQPHTGTKAALLVLRRREQPLENIHDSENTDIFMSAPRWIGHDRRGNAVYKRLPDGTLSDEILSDFDDVLKAFKKYKEGMNPHLSHSQSFVIQNSQILEDRDLRINAKRYFPGKITVSSSQSLKDKAEYTGFEIAKIRDLVTDIFYPNRFRRDYVDYYPGAVPFLGGTNISQLTLTNNKWLSHNDPNLDKLRVHSGWVIVTRSGSTGIVSIVPEVWDGYAMSEHIIRIVPDAEKIDPEYIHSFLRTKYAQEILSRGIFGSVIDEITPEYIGEIEIPILQSKNKMTTILSKAKKARKARNTAIDCLNEVTAILDEAFESLSN